MIKKAVFSYLNPQNSYKNASGFNNFRDYLMTQSISVLYAQKHFEKVEIISDDWGVNILKNKVGLPVDFSTDANNIKGVSPFFWAYGKLYAYSLQEEPFIHIDNDAIIMAKLPDRILNAGLCFQSNEYFDRPGYGWYNELMKSWQRCPVKPEIIKNNLVSDYAYNCGIAGGNDLEHFQEWINTSKEYIFASKNQQVFFDIFKHLLIHQNLFHEQFFNSCIIKAHNKRKNVEVLGINVEDIKTNGIKFVHLWGLSKRDTKLMQKVYIRMKTEFPEIYKNIMIFAEKEHI